MAMLTLVKRQGITLLVFAIYFLFAGYVYAEEKPLKLYEQKIKAGLVYNLLKYTTWPPTSAVKAKEQLQVCLFGDDPFDGYLAPLAGRTAQQSLIFITHVKTLQDITACSVVIIHRSEETRLAELLDFLRRGNVLTISDIAHFALRGGMVEMAKEDDKITLYVNKGAVDRAGLDIPQHMLRLAKIVSS